MKVGEGGKAFGSVSKKEIAAAAADQLKLDIDKKKLVLPEPIKTFGNHEVPGKTSQGCNREADSESNGGVRFYG